MAKFGELGSPAARVRETRELPGDTSGWGWDGSKRWGHGVRRRFGGLLTGGDAPSSFGGSGWALELQQGEAKLVVALVWAGHGELELAGNGGLRREEKSGSRARLRPGFYL